MKFLAALLALSSLFATSYANAQCFFHRKVDKAPRILKSLPCENDGSETVPQTLAEANALARKQCHEDSKINKLIQLQDEKDELAAVSRGYHDIAFRLFVASQIAEMHSEKDLSKRFSIEAELVGAKSDNNVVATIWLRNAEEQVFRMICEEEPYKTFLEKFSPSYAETISGVGWHDSVAFGNFKTLTEEYCGMKLKEPIYWAAFRLIPLEKFEGKRKGYPPSAKFTTADRLALEAFYHQYK